MSLLDAVDEAASNREMQRIFTIIRERLPEMQGGTIQFGTLVQNYDEVMWVARVTLEDGRWCLVEGCGYRILGVSSAMGWVTRMPQSGLPETEFLSPSWLVER